MKIGQNGTNKKISSSLDLFSYKFYFTRMKIHLFAIYFLQLFQFLCFILQSSSSFFPDTNKQAEENLFCLFVCIFIVLLRSLACCILCCNFFHLFSSVAVFVGFPVLHLVVLATKYCSLHAVWIDLVQPSPQYCGITKALSIM